LKQNIEALTLSLSKDDIDEIESAIPFDLGFPGTFMYRDGKTSHYQDVWLLSMGGTHDYVPETKSISPPQGGE